MNLFPGVETDSELLTKEQLADRLGVNPGTIDRRIPQGLPIARRGSPGRSKHLFSEAAVREWEHTRQARKGGRPGTYSKAREARDSAQARLLELQYSIKTREYVSAEVMEKLWAKDIAAVRAMLLAWPNHLAGEVARVLQRDGESGVEELIEREVHRVLAELSTTRRGIDCPHCGRNFPVYPRDPCHVRVETAGNDYDERTTE